MEPRAKPVAVNTMMQKLLLLVAALDVTGCAARERPPSRSASSALPPPSSALDAAPLRQALERAVTESAGLDTLRLFVECREGSAMTSVKVFGNGIGIWNDERQFLLVSDQIGSLLRALRRADFPGMEDTYGGAGSLRKPRPPSPDGGGMVTIVTCRIDLGLAGYDKQVVQLAPGEQSPTLKKLAEDLLRVCHPRAQLGLAASSLRDGLEKLSRKELAPETWLVVMHRKPGEKRGNAVPPGFLLRIAGCQATTQPYDPVTGYGDRVLLDVGAKAVGTLARELATRDPASWPVNLYAADYTDLTIRVLNHEKTVQARQFAGLAPATHGHHQKAFEEVLEVLERLHRTVVERGRPTPTAAFGGHRLRKELPFAP
jgi:hypothetical protein